MDKAGFMATRARAVVRPLIGVQQHSVVITGALLIRCIERDRSPYTGDGVVELEEEDGGSVEDEAEVVPGLRVAPLEELGGLDV